MKVDLNFAVKMIRKKFLFIALLLHAIASNYIIECNNEGFFTVVATALLRNQQLYRVSVAYQGYKDDKVLEIGVKELREDSSGLEIYKNVTLKGDGLQNIEFEVSFIFL